MQMLSDPYMENWERLIIDRNVCATALAVKIHWIERKCVRASLDGIFITASTHLAEPHKGPKIEKLELKAA